MPRRAPLRPKIFSILCRFSDSLAKSYVGALLEGLAPSSRGNPGSAPALVVIFAETISEASGFNRSLNLFANRILKFACHLIFTLDSDL